MKLLKDLYVPEWEKGKEEARETREFIDWLIEYGVD